MRQIYFFVSAMLIFLMACGRSLPSLPPIISTHLEAIEAREIQFPQDLSKDLQTQQLKVSDLSQAKAKVVVYVNADCSVCYAQVNGWEKLKEEFSSYESLNIFFIAFGATEDMITFNLE
ncbi:MAG: hypothetical protein AAFR59_13470, partial [Bacteroidota bacterium]